MFRSSFSVCARAQANLLVIGDTVMQIISFNFARAVGFVLRQITYQMHEALWTSVFPRACSKGPNGTARGLLGGLHPSRTSKQKLLHWTETMITTVVCNLISIGAQTPLGRGNDLSARIR